MYSPDLDFNIEKDSTEPTLIPNGFYYGNVTKVAYNEERLSIDWTITLIDNGGYCLDNETEIDGAQLVFSNWLPKPSDKDEKTSSGRMTKRQAKINMLKDFIEKMKLPQNTVGEIIEAINGAEYIGLEVDVQVETRTWDGNTFNSIKRMNSR